MVYMNPLFQADLLKAEGDCRSALMVVDKVLSSSIIFIPLHPSFLPSLISSSLPSCPLLNLSLPFCLPSTYCDLSKLLPQMSANLTGCNAHDGNPALDISPPHAYIQLQMDAPSLLQRGLPRALPGLEEVTVESVKEGTQYESGEFQDPPQLPQGRPV